MTSLLLMVQKHLNLSLPIELSPALQAMPPPKVNQCLSERDNFRHQLKLKSKSAVLYLPRGGGQTKAGADKITALHGG